MGRCWGEAAASCAGFELPLPAQKCCTSLLLRQKVMIYLSPSLGKVLWTLNPNHLSNGTLAAPVVVLPDLDEDGVRDLVVLAIGELQPDLCFLLVSGRTGSPVGRPVKYNIVGVGNLIGPQVYITASGAVYILFGFGKKQGWL